MSKTKLLLSLVVLAGLIGGALYYYRPAEGKPAPAAATATPSSQTYVLTSPPRETPEAGEQFYGPIAAYLSEVTGKRVVYRHPGTWGLYRTEMLNGNFDIIFDGGHFSDYRARKLGYHIVAKMPKLQEFVIIVQKDDKASSIDELAGHTFCAPPPPNQGALIALSRFSNPTRQPIVVPITGDFWKGVYDSVVEGRCRGGVLVMGNLQKYNTSGAVRVLYKTAPQPNQAWSVGPRVSPEDRAKIAAALISPQASAPTERLRERFNVGPSFVEANNAEYVGLGDVLRSEFGFEAIASN